MIAHIPLEEEGGFINIWINRGDTGVPISVFIPFGAAILVSAHVVHGGCYGSRGSSRFHMILKPKEEHTKWEGKDIQLSGELFWKYPQMAGYSIVKLCYEDPQFVEMFDHQTEDNYLLRQKVGFKPPIQNYPDYPRVGVEKDEAHKWRDIQPF